MFANKKKILLVIAGLTHLVLFWQIDVDAQDGVAASAFDEILEEWHQSYERVIHSVYFECETIYPNPNTKNFKKVRRDGNRKCNIIEFQSGNDRGSSLSLIHI